VALIEPHLVQELKHPLLPGSAIVPAVKAEYLVQTVTGALAGIERDIWILEDDLKVPGPLASLGRR
jgi:hypothetical protein